MTNEHLNEDACSKPPIKTMKTVRKNCTDVIVDDFELILTILYFICLCTQTFGKDHEI